MSASSSHYPSSSSSAGGRTRKRTGSNMRPGFTRSPSSLGGIRAGVSMGTRAPPFETIYHPTHRQFSNQASTRSRGRAYTRSKRPTPTAHQASTHSSISRHQWQAPFLSSNSYNPTAILDSQEWPPLPMPTGCGFMTSVHPPVARALHLVRQNRTSQHPSRPPVDPDLDIPYTTTRHMGPNQSGQPLPPLSVPPGIPTSSLRPCRLSSTGWKQRKMQRINFNSRFCNNIYSLLSEHS